MSKATLHYMDLVQLESRRRRQEAYRFIAGGASLALVMMSLTLFYR